MFFAESFAFSYIKPEKNVFLQKEIKQPYVTNSSNILPDIRALLRLSFDEDRKQVGQIDISLLFCIIRNVNIKIIASKNRWYQWRTQGHYKSSKWSDFGKLRLVTIFKFIHN